MYCVPGIARNCRPKPELRIVPPDLRSELCPRNCGIGPRNCRNCAPSGRSLSYVLCPRNFPTPRCRQHASARRPAFSPAAPRIIPRHRSPFEVPVIRYSIATDSISPWSTAIRYTASTNFAFAPSAREASEGGNTAATFSTASRVIGIAAPVVM